MPDNYNPGNKAGKNNGLRSGWPATRRRQIHIGIVARGSEREFGENKMISLT